jgi:lycopene cyclase CruA
MKELLYLEIPTPQTDAVRSWLQSEFQPSHGQLQPTANGVLWQVGAAEVSIFVWTLQRTTYLKVFQWSTVGVPQERSLLQELTQGLRQVFPERYPAPPSIDLSQQTIFEALAEQYPLTVKYFQAMPNGEYDLQRVYWWEQRWRQNARTPQPPQPVVVQQSVPFVGVPSYDLIYVGGALGLLHAAAMAQLGYRVLLLERLPVGKMNREWNISRAEFQSVIDLGLFSPEEFEGLITREYRDGFHKFFDGNNPPQCWSQILHTPRVLNVAIDSELLLGLCLEKLQAAGGEVWSETEFQRAEIRDGGVMVSAIDRPTQQPRQATGRLVVDAMGTASPIAWQLNGGRAFDSVCPTVGAVLAGGMAPQVWDADYGDVLNSHGDISKGRQLIWELFPAAGDDLTIYLFHYHQVHPDNPGSLLEMYEDFFTILPEYRCCDLDQVVWKKATFGYIPGHFSWSGQERRIACDRLIAIGDAASLQSPLVFTGFGSLVRNLRRLTQLLHTALQHDLLQAQHLEPIRAYQSNIAVTWMFSKGMMVPTGRSLPPQRINAMLNTFFEVLARQEQPVAEAFIKDRGTWWDFTRMALLAARLNPSLLLWIWQMAGPRDLLRWLGVFAEFTLGSFWAWLLAWLPGWLVQNQSWLEGRYPALWLWLLARAYGVTYGMGRPQAMPTFGFELPQGVAQSSAAGECLSVKA